MSIIRKLNKLGRAVSERYPYINNGGCCVYAALVAEALIYHKINCSGIVASWDAGDISIDEVRANVRKNALDEWEYNGVLFSHVGLEFEHNGRIRHYDTSGAKFAKKNFDGMKVYKGRLRIDELKKLASKRQGWNESFNRRHIPAIREMVKEYLEVN